MQALREPALAGPVQAGLEHLARMRSHLHRQQLEGKHPDPYEDLANAELPGLMAEARA